MNGKKVGRIPALCSISAVELKQAHRNRGGHGATVPFYSNYIPSNPPPNFFDLPPGLSKTSVAEGKFLIVRVVVMWYAGIGFTDVQKSGGMPPPCPTGSYGPGRWQRAIIFVWCCWHLVTTSNEKCTTCCPPNLLHMNGAKKVPRQQPSKVESIWFSSGIPAH